MTLDSERSGTQGWVIIRLTAEEAAIFANDCENLCNAVGEDHATIELGLRRLSDRAEGKV